MVAWSLCGISQPRRGAGQEGIIRKECEKGNPSRLPGGVGGPWSRGGAAPGEGKLAPGKAERGRPPPVHRTYRHLGQDLGSAWVGGAGCGPGSGRWKAGPAGLRLRVSSASPGRRIPSGPSLDSGARRVGTSRAQRPCCKPQAGAGPPPSGPPGARGPQVPQGGALELDLGRSLACL